MFSLSQAMSAKTGSSYFDKDGYYADAKNTQWYGEGAQKLGLIGAVNKMDFDIVLDGFDPKTKTPLVKNAGDSDRRGYIDGTFSAPKSVSILAYADEKIEDAHNKAVEETIKKIEREYAYTRQAGSAKGTMETVKTGNLVMARINHYSSRELDTQLHSHIIFSNLTQGEDGKWRSIEPRKIYEDQMYFGQIYRNELAQNLKKIGYKIDVTDRKNGFFEVAGVPKDLREMTSKRRKQVEEKRKKNDEKYKNDPTYQALSEAQKMEKAAKETRKLKTGATEEDIQQINRKEMEKIVGKSLEELREEALSTAAPGPAAAVLSAAECVRLALDDAAERESALTEKAIIGLALKSGLGHYTAGQLIEELRRQPDVEHLGTVGRMEREYFTTAAIREAERGIVDYAQRGMGQAGAAAISLEAMEGHFTRIEGEGKQLSTGQRAAVNMICTTSDRVSLVQGDAGAGKTFAMEVVREAMAAEGITVRGFAPTGVAAKELGDAGVESVTVDKFLANEELRDKTAPGEVWLVDESGMMGSLKMKRFLDAAAERDAKVVLIGDTKQFQSVEQGKIFAELQAKTDVAKTEITEVKRQKTEHTVAAVKAIKNRDFDAAFDILAKHGGLKEIAGREGRIGYMVNEYLNDRRDRVESVILTGNNADRNEINRRIRAELAGDGTVTGGGSFDTFAKVDAGELAKSFAESYSPGQVIITKKDCDPIPRGTQAKVEAIDIENNTIRLRYFNKEAGHYDVADIDVKKYGGKYDVCDVIKKDFGVGDCVLFTKNDPRVGVANGQTGVIKNILEDGTAIIAVGKGGKEIECNLRNNGPKGYTYLDHAYCITNHKSQGSSYDKVIVNADVSGQRTNYNAFYVQATRAKTDIQIVTDNKEKLMEQAQHRQDKISTLDFDDLLNKFDDSANNRRDELIEAELVNTAEIRKELNDNAVKDRADYFQEINSDDYLDHVIDVMRKRSQEQGVTPESANVIKQGYQLNGAHWTNYQRPPNVVAAMLNKDGKEIATLSAITDNTYKVNYGRITEENADYKYLCQRVTVNEIVGEMNRLQKSYGMEM